MRGSRFGKTTESAKRIFTKSTTHTEMRTRDMEESCLVVLPNARRASDRFVHCVLGVKWGGGHVAAPFVPMVVALVLNFLCTQYYSLREGG